MDASLTSAPAAQRLSATFPLSHLCRAAQSYQALPADLPDQAALMDMAAARVTGAVAQPCVLDAAEEIRIAYRVMHQICLPACLPHPSACLPEIGEQPALQPGTAYN